MPDPDPLLDVRGLSRGFYGVQALKAAILRGPARHRHGLIGPNGAGKSTAFQCISGVVPAELVCLSTGGHHRRAAGPHQPPGLVRSFQIARGIPRLTVLENLLFYGPRNPANGRRRDLAPPARRREEALRARARYRGAAAPGPVLDNQAAALSGGQKKLMEIGRALMAEPKLLLLDDPWPA